MKKENPSAKDFSLEIQERQVNDSFSSMIKLRRQQLGLTLKDVERLSGVDASYVHRVESGERKTPSIAVVEKLCQALNIPIEDALNSVGVKKIAAQKVRPIEEVILTASYSIKGEKATKEEKEALAQIVMKILEFKWDEASKAYEAVELINLVEKFKKMC